MAAADRAPAEACLMLFSAVSSPLPCGFSMRTQRRSTPAKKHSGAGSFKLLASKSSTVGLRLAAHSANINFKLSPCMSPAGCAYDHAAAALHTMVHFS